MSLLDIVGELFLFGTKDIEQGKIKPPRILNVFYFLLIPGAVWFAWEANAIANLQSPFLFILLFGIMGIVLSFLMMYLLWRTGRVAFFTKRFAMIILAPILLLTISCASLINTSKSEKGRLGFDLIQKP